MKASASRWLVLAAASLAACATVPRGPDVEVMPGPGKSFEQFQVDDRVCRDYAGSSLGPEDGQAGAANVAQGAAIGTVGGAVAGAMLGGGRGGAVIGGAGMGMIMGSAIGASGAGQYEHVAQRRYDIAYMQCMSAKGNQVPSPRPRRYYRNYPPVPPSGAPDEAPPPMPSGPPPPP